MGSICSKGNEPRAAQALQQQAFVAASDPAGTKLTPDQQKDWEQKLKKYAYIVSITCDCLTAIDKIATEKLSGKPKAIVDSGVRAVFAGLSKLYTMLESGYKQAQSGIKPDFTNEVPFPNQPPPLPSEEEHFSSWFQIAWETVETAMNILAMKNSRIAEILPPIEAAGDELVKDLQRYFPTNQAYAQQMLGFPFLPSVKIGIGFSI